MVSVVFFGLAATMKVTELTGPLIVMMLLVADKFHILRLQLNSDGKFRLKVVSLLAIFGIIAGWVFYAKYYNNLHGSAQFSTYTFPIWAMDKEAITYTLHQMDKLWFKDYFYPPVFCLMLTALVAMFVFYKHSDKLLLMLSLLLVPALIAYSLLWFQALGDHDYFYLGFYVLPALVFINLFHLLQQLRWHWLFRGLLMAGCILLMVIDAGYARDRQYHRYNSWQNDYNDKKDLYTIGPWLDQSGITRSDTIIFYPHAYTSDPCIS